MDGINGVEGSYSSFVPSRCSAKSILIQMGYWMRLKFWQMPAAPKICDSLIS